MAGGEDAVPFVKEPIPPTHAVLRFVEKKYAKERATGLKLSASTFNGLYHDGVSVDWERYCNAAECRSHADPSDDVVGVVRLNVGRIRDVDGLEVEHDPKPENQAHSLITGRSLDDEQLNTARGKLKEIAEWVPEAEG